MSFELALEELEGDYGGGGKGYVGSCYAPPEEAEVSVQLAHVVRTSRPPEALFGVLDPLVHPVQGEAVEQREILVVGAHLHKFSLPISVRLLKDGNDRSPSDPVQANPEVVSWILSFKEEEKNVHGSWQSQVCAHNLERPYERPAVRVKLGGGDVELG